jgi:tRNA (guanine37-N1)-methyltransferase
MRIDVLSLFPEMFEGVLGLGVLGRAVERGIVDVEVTNIRDFSIGNYGKVDDKPYGGGCGMVMKCEPVFDCFDSVMKKNPAPGRVIMLTPAGKKFDQAMAEEFSNEDRLIMMAGRYEGFDDRIREGLNAEPVSIGDYVLSGGELGAMVLIDAVVRLMKGVLGDDESSTDESFSDGLLEYGQYTRPEEFRGMKVPEVLLSGNHAKIEKWRKEQSLERTKLWRPDLLEGDKEKGSA